MDDAAAAARAERWDKLRAKLEAARRDAPDITEEELVDEILARRERGSDAGPPG
jgi:hypothetical protein